MNPIWSQRNLLRCIIRNRLGVDLEYMNQFVQAWIKLLCILSAARMFLERAKSIQGFLHRYTDPFTYYARRCTSLPILRNYLLASSFSTFHLSSVFARLSPRRMSSSLVPRLIDIGSNLSDPVFHGYYHSYDDKRKEERSHADDFLNIL